MVYIDRLQEVKNFNKNWSYKFASHLTADSFDELVNFAIKIGLKSEWLQRSRNGTWHYDLTRKYRDKAIKNGAIKI